MFKKLLAFLPLAGILAACSSGVVDTWDPESEIKREKAYETKCQEMKDNATHRQEVRPNRLPSYYYLDGNIFYNVSLCGLSSDNPYVIGKTYTIDGYKVKAIKQGDEIIIYRKHPERGPTWKEVYKPIQ